jgi:hypothetical protein
MHAHIIFHVYLSKKYVHYPNHVIDWNMIEVEPKEDFQVDPMCILNQKVKVLWNKSIM